MMNVKYKCGTCTTETVVENVTDMKKLSCPVCGVKKDLKENDSSKKQILKG